MKTTLEAQTEPQLSRGLARVCTVRAPVNTVAISFEQLQLLVTFTITKHPRHACAAKLRSLHTGSLTRNKRSRQRAVLQRHGFQLGERHDKQDHNLSRLDRGASGSIAHQPGSLSYRAALLKDPWLSPSYSWDLQRAPNTPPCHGKTNRPHQVLYFCKRGACREDF